jgi:biofilm PGA synthesis N-glycosyltransferase PgaC
MRLPSKIGFLPRSPAAVAVDEPALDPLIVDAISAQQGRSGAANSGWYIPVIAKFALATGLGLAWALFSLKISARWIDELALVTGTFASYLIIFSIAIVPGFMNCFLITSLLMDRRPQRKGLPDYPPITVLVAAYNEQASILGTLNSIELNEYPGPLQVIVIDDGSKDHTAAIVEGFTRDHPNFRLLRQPKNQGKAHALNAGLAQVKTNLVVTVDGDCYAFVHSLRHLVERIVNDPPGTAAVAGAVHVRNSRKNWVTATQEWDYFHGIAAVKRMQSLYQGTLVAQGAFSIYQAAVLREAGGWSQTVGEDIVLTWDILKRGYRVGYAEDAVLFTNAPESVGALVRQRERWSRGMIEAFKKHWQLLFQPKLRTVFIWWNLSFPIMDLVFTFVFIPGLVAALFGYYLLAGPMTLLVLPVTMMVNLVMYQIGQRMFGHQALKVRRNIGGFFLYVLMYSIIMQPACVLGYFKELLNIKKTWGTK